MNQSIDPRCCDMRRKTRFSVVALSQEESGLPDSVLADFLTFDRSPLGRDVVAFRFCPWCGQPWIHTGRVVEPPLEPEAGEEWKK